ncbi:uncharacterized protein EKO05_0003279 [Ascochyta rabiei]|uniref:Uncharacterized protein n=1 Tax=Didymella rabiei TaxID=5454 RepID=A0A163IAS2_DIDRA|nr:uncharacterized protein EKO05_0003279 [Ascochyta rabiei]KZM25676.1 hypothetical protein ST47_g3218 [Ascochyta rabiei]UPX12741.1 hypothetical protein EKO05_0003279 [Ascochyta rabiei]
MRLHPLSTLHLSLHLYLHLPYVLSQSTNTTSLTAPALVTNNNRTVIQCWRLRIPFQTSSTPGVVGAKAATVANVTNMAYTVLPPRFDGGLHRAPAPQIVHFVSGLAHITLPDDPDRDLWLVGGVGGLLLAVDTTGTGHITRYPSDQHTVGLLAPFEGGRVPEYEVVKNGGCEGVQTFP